MTTIFLAVGLVIYRGGEGRINSYESDICKRLERLDIAALKPMHFHNFFRKLLYTLIV